MNQCPFCNIVEHISPILPFSLLNDLKVNILYSGKDFCIIPDIAPITPFHLLLLPYEHYVSISSISDNHELNSLKKMVATFNLKVSNKETLFFEHGSCVNTKGDSSCIPHAHLHAIPFSQDDFNFLIKFTTENLSSPSDLGLKEAYFYLEYLENQKYWEDKSGKRQFFRKIISDIYGNNRFPWQTCLYGRELIDTQAWLNTCITEWRKMSYYT